MKKSRNENSELILNDSNEISTKDEAVEEHVHCVGFYMIPYVQVNFQR